MSVGGKGTSNQIRLRLDSSTWRIAIAEMQEDFHG